MALAALSITAPAIAQDDFTWRLEEEFVFLEFRDPGTLTLQDTSGRESELDFGYEGLTYAVVDTWAKGKTIRVVYSPERGTEILDPESGENFPIARARPRLDALTDHCLAASPAMLGRRVCYDEAAEHWDVELNRAYRSVMKSDLSQGTKDAIRTAQREWIEFRDTSNAATAAVAAEKGGSARALEAGSAAVALVRSQTLRLRGYRY